VATSSSSALEWFNSQWACGYVFCSPAVIFRRRPIMACWDSRGIVELRPGPAPQFPVVPVSTACRRRPRILKNPAFEVAEDDPVRVVTEHVCGVTGTLRRRRARR